MDHVQGLQKEISRLDSDSALTAVSQVVAAGTGV